MSGIFLRCLVLLIALWPVLGLGQEPVFEDTMAERTRACSHCHGKQGRAGPDGYYPRLAGKPAAYLYNQLLNFREGRRHYSLMTGLLEEHGFRVERGISGFPTGFLATWGSGSPVIALHTDPNETRITDL